MSRQTDPEGDQDAQNPHVPEGETAPKNEDATDGANERGDGNESNEPELHRIRSLALSERPTPTSNASVLSLANAHVAAALADDEGYEAHERDRTDHAAPAAAMPKRGPSPSTPDVQDVQVSHPADVVGEMRDRFSLGDYTGALAAAEALLVDFPEHTEARRCADNCRSVLEQMYAARIGPLDRIPHVAVPREKLQWLSIDHRAGFVLSHVDGVSSLQMIMAACGMPMLDVLRILHELVHSRVIAFR
ncbi:hypothetical protein [Pendulispora albinea]|uniref:Uncharacterized protein n=1 Tax=Pendulispora albinea TaxID=2741071 RepID=A0ABZ2LJY2_9BACT